MKGTNLRAASDMRCAALSGTVGSFGTICGVYEQRASCCRDFWPSLEDGKTQNPRCDKAREFHNLEPLRENDWAVFNAERHT